MQGFEALPLMYILQEGLNTDSGSTTKAAKFDGITE